MDLQKTIDNLRKGGFTVSYFETGREAADYIAGQLHGKTVGIGGCETAKQIGLYDRIIGDNTVYWHTLEPTREVMLNADHAQVFISSANAIAETGEIINIDGRGNRVSALLYGPEKLYIIAGVNKICPDFDSAMYRARNVAAPLNARRLNKKTPCALSAEMKCYDCSSPERICRGFTILARAVTGIASSEVVLINETLGL